MGENYCQARTWSQAQSGSWAGSHRSNGCQRKASDRNAEGYWACRQHLAKPPANGWNL